MIFKKKSLRRNSKTFSGQNQKFKGFFRPKSGDLQKKVFAKIQRLSWPESEIWRFFPTKIRWSPTKSLFRLWVSSRTKKTPLFRSKWRHVLHNLGSQIPLRGGAVFIFVTKIGLKSTKMCYFAYFSSQWRELEPSYPPSATLLCDYAISFCYRSLKIF